MSKPPRRTVYLDGEKVDNQFGTHEYERLKQLLRRRRSSVSEWFRIKAREEIEKEP
jgi:hypothetical protein